jgi:hypothetical protein
MQFLFVTVVPKYLNSDTFPDNLLAVSKWRVILYGIFVLALYITVVRIDLELMCSIRFPSLIFLDFPNGIFGNKVEKQWR